ncbi:MAG TPA: ABC transporter substrate-binding protein, partial [Candidatus Binatus sp.]|nr:ABC transporter substrate-binding protein [Candidatus Binatus sp.]
MKTIFRPGLLATILLAIGASAVQSAQVERIGVIHLGGVFSTVVDGLRAGLKEQGLEDGKQFSLDVRDLKGDAKSAGNVAQSLERDKVKLLFTVATPPTTGAMKQTRNIPIVFAVGADAVAQGYVKSFAQPGGRLTGVQYLAVDLAGKRLEILKEIIPTLRNIVTFYDPASAVSKESAKLGRDEAQRRNLKLVEREVKSIDALKEALNSLKAGEFDAYLYIADPMVASQSQSVIDVALAKKLPTMFHDQALVANGGLASYGQSYFEIGRRAAKYVRQVLAGDAPSNLRVETMEDVDLAFNLVT